MEKGQSNSSLSPEPIGLSTGDSAGVSAGVFAGIFAGVSTSVTGGFAAGVSAGVSTGVLIVLSKQVFLTIGPTNMLSAR